MAFLETGRLLFRSHERADEDYFVPMQMDPEVRRYVGGRAWSREEAVRRFREQYLGKPVDTSNLCATIFKPENRYIGFCGLRLNGPYARSAHLGYYLDRAYWGRGLASEASRAFIELGFSQLGLDQISAQVDLGHDASERIVNKFGFVYVDEEHLPGRVICTYRLLKSDWSSGAV